MTEAFIKLCKSRLTEDLMGEPACFMLLTQIAYRAKRTEGISVYGLCVGEAMLGDYGTIGLTRQKFRTALKKLESLGMITIRTTNRGTVAKLVCKDVFDINEEAVNHQSNLGLTTNKNINNNTHKRGLKGNFGKFNMVRLSDEEFNRLKSEIGEEKLKKIIDQLDEKIAEGREKSENHFVTVMKYSRYLRESKVVNLRKVKVPEVKSASFKVKSKSQLYGEA